MDNLGFFLLGLPLLGIVIFIHEAGHFLAARWCGVEVEAFAIGWGKPIWRWKPGRTEYRICLFPLGGYCKMKGEQFLIKAYENPDETPVPEAGSFFAASPWKRIIISFAGPFFNLLTALLVFFVLSWTGVPYNSVPAKVILIEHQQGKPVQPAEAAGIQTGDEVLSVNGNSIHSFREFQLLIGASKDVPLSIVVRRNGSSFTYTVHPAWLEDEQRSLIGVYPWQDPVVKSVVSKSSAEIAGFQAGDRLLSMNGKEVRNTVDIMNVLTDKSPSYEVVFLRNGSEQKTRIIPDLEKGKVSLGLDFMDINYPAVGKPFSDAFLSGTEQTGRLLSQMVHGLVQLFIGKLNISENLSGPIGMSSMIGKLTTTGFLEGWGEGLGAVASILAFISLALFLMNLLPIPALDGGSIVLNVVEIFKRKPLKPKVYVVYQQIGGVLILLLLIFTTINDLFSPFSH